MFGHQWPALEFPLGTRSAQPCEDRVVKWRNWFEIPPNAEGHEHDESETQQEEVNVIIRGSGVYRIEGTEIPVGVGTFLRFDPGTTRVPVAGPDGMTMIAVGARRGSYEPRGPF